MKIKTAGKKLFTYAYTAAAAVSVAVAVSYSALHVAAQNKNNQNKLQTWLNQQLPVDVAFDDMRFIWRGFYPGISLLNARIIHKKDDSIRWGMQELHAIFDLPNMLLSKQLRLSELVVVKTQLTLETQDYSHYRVQHFPELQLSLDASHQANWLKQFSLYESTVHIVHPKQHYTFKQIDIAVVPEKDMLIHGHATYQQDNQAPCFVNFVHQTQKNNQTQASVSHQWGLSVYGELEQLSDILQSHHLIDAGTQPLQFKAKGNVAARAVVHRQGQGLRFDATVNVRSLDVAYQDSSLTADLADFQLIGSKHEDNVNLTLGKHHFENLRLNTQNISDLNDARFTLQTHPSAQAGRFWHITATAIPAVILKEIKNVQLIIGNKLAFQPPIDFINGHFHYLDAAFSVAPGSHELQMLKADFSNLAVIVREKYELEQLSGQISFADNIGKIKLDSKEVAVFHDQWFDRPLIADTLEGIVFVEKSVDNDYIISSPLLNVSINDAKTAHQFQVRFGQDVTHRVSPQVDWIAQISQLSMGHFKSYLPIKKLNPPLNEWLSHALQGGNIRQGNVVLRGSLDQFPFDKAQGVFQAGMELEDVTLKFSPDWPALTDANIDLLFENRSFYAKAHRGKLQDTQLMQVTASIDDLSVKPALLNVQMETRTTMAQGMSIIDESPLKEKIGSGLHRHELAGNMLLNLDMAIPLTKKQPSAIKVKGVLEASEAALVVSDQKLQLTDVSGKIQFTEHSLASTKLKARIGSEYSTIAFHTELKDQPKTHIKASGKVDLAQFIPQGQPDLVKALQGAANYTAEFDLIGEETQQHGQFKVSSDLKGVTIDLFDPFSKSSNQTRPLQIKGLIKQNGQHDYTLRFVDAEINLLLNPPKPDLPTSQQKRLEALHVHFGRAPIPESAYKSHFSITGDLATLDVKPLMDKFAGIKPADDAALKEIQPVIDVHIQSLNLLGLPIEDAVIEGRYDRGLENMLYSIQSDVVAGFVSVPVNDTSRVIAVDLEHLVVKDKPSDGHASADWFKRGNQDKNALKSPLEIKIKHLLVEEKKFNQLHAQLEPIQFGYYIKNLDFMLGGSEVDSTGYWHYLSGTSQVDLSGTVKTKNLGTTMAALGKKGTLRQGKGDMQFAFSWEGTPIDINMPSLSGEIKFKLKDGLIQGVNPGFGRVLSLLNLDNIQRRLNLDFSDVTKEGMTFDTLSGRIHLLDGVVHSDKIVLDSPSVKIETTFRTGLNDQQLNGHLDVMPNLTGSLPIAAAIAVGNPAVGAAVWVMDKLFGKKIQEINRFGYRLSGTWENPHIEEMTVKSAKRHVRK